MAIAISDAHRELASVARSFLERNDARAHARSLLDAPDETLPPFWKQAADLGWLGLHIPEEVGGSGYGLTELVVVLEELGRALAPGPFLPTVMSSALIVRAGTTRSAPVSSRASLDGSPVAALGLGGDAAARRRRHARRRGGPRARGRARRRARAAGRRRHGHGRAPRAGVTRRTHPASLDPTRRVGRVRLSNVTVEPDAWFREALPVARGWLAARGGRRRRRRAGVRRDGERVREGPSAVRSPDRDVPGGQAPLRQHARGRRARDRRGVGRGARGQRRPRAVRARGAAAAVALGAPRLLPRNAQLNIQVHGGIGFTWEHDGHLLLRRAATLAALFDADAAASTVTRCFARRSHTRLHDFELPPEAEEYRERRRARSRPSSPRSMPTRSSRA